MEVLASQYLEILSKAFRKHLNLEKVRYDKIVKRSIEFYKDEYLEYDQRDLFEEEIKVYNSTLRFKIKNGVIIRKIFAENSKIVLNFDSDFSIVYDEVYAKGNVEYKVYGKIGEAYHYFKLIPLENSSVISKVKNFVEKNLVSIGTIFIPENSVNSFGSLEKYFLTKEKASVISFPILDVLNDTSRAFHSSKTIKLEEEQIFYLNIKGLKPSKIEKLILEDFLKE